MLFEGGDIFMQVRLPIHKFLRTLKEIFLPI